MEENTVLTGQTCQKCGRNVEKPCTTCNKKKIQEVVKENDENKKKCKSCNKAIKQFSPYIILTLFCTFFFIVGMYQSILYLIELFSH
jgi:hypothetical protein